ncbi:hypothetical protein KCU65_g207, partial [Aureobasidium melanogenum]
MAPDTARPPSAELVTNKTEIENSGPALSHLFSNAWSPRKCRSLLLIRIHYARLASKSHVRYSQTTSEAAVLQGDAVPGNRTYIILAYILLGGMLGSSFMSTAVNVDMLTCVGVVND